MLKSKEYFVDRDEQRNQVAAFFDPLNTESLFIITGLPGMGKTTLATKILNDVVKDRYEVLWIECRTDVTSQRFLHEISNIADDFGYPSTELAALNAIGPATDDIVESKQAKTLFNFLNWAGTKGSEKRIKPLALFFDDFENVMDPKLPLLISKITRGDLNAKIVLITANIGLINKYLLMAPIGSALCEVEELPRSGCEELINHEAHEGNITALSNLTQEHLTQIMKKTGGVPDHLRFFINMARNNTLKQLLVLPDYDEDSNALFRKLYDSLDDTARMVAESACILRLSPTPEQLRQICGLDERAFAHAVNLLCDRHVLKLNGTTYTMPKSLADYVREHLHVSSAGRLHQLNLRAASMYQGQVKQEPQNEVDFRLESSHYYVQAGEVTEGANVLEPVVGTLLNWGRYQEVSDIVAEFDRVDRGQPVTTILPSRLLLALSETLHARDRESQMAVKVLNDLILTSEGETKILAMQRLAFIEREVSDSYDQAKKLYDESREMAKTLGLVKCQLDALYGLQHIAYFEGEYDLALQYNEERLHILMRLGQQSPQEHDDVGNNYVLDNEAWTKANRANIYRERGDFETALKLYQEALATWKNLRTPPPWRVGWTEYDIGQIYYQQRKFSEAHEFFTAAGQVFQDNAYTYGVAHVESEYGRNGSQLLAPDGTHRKSLDECLRHVNDAINLLSSYPSARAFAITAKGEIYLNFGDFKEAVKFLEQGLDNETKLQKTNFRKVGKCFHLIGLATGGQASILLQEVGETDAACKRFAEALGYLKEASKNYEYVKVDLNLGGLQQDIERMQRFYDSCR